MLIGDILKLKKGKEIIYCGTIFVEDIFIIQKRTKENHNNFNKIADLIRGILWAGINPVDEQSMKPDFRVLTDKEK